jgi:UDPglucose 6-dehydrogenase/GDP-mannose 6-dehydrogenase
MKVAIVGTGYVGLVTGVCLASRGHRVICVDKNQAIVDQLNKKVPTIYEKNLPELLTEVYSSGNFLASSNLAESLKDVEIVLVAVGTPSPDGAIDLSQVISAITEIGEYIRWTKKFISVVIKSTVTPSTTDLVIRNQLEKTSGGKVGVDFGLGMNPEFLREGNAIEDFMSPDRIVLGYEDEQTLNRLRLLYSSWEVGLVEVNTRTAEMIKYANNALLAIQISSVNELSNLAANLGGIDSMDVMRGVFLDKRWSITSQGERVQLGILDYMIPGCGFGGSCFPKDVKALRTMGKSLGLPMSLLDSVLDVNERQPLEVVKALSAKIGTLLGVKILVLGLAFKPGTDDVRETASEKIITTLLQSGAEVFAHDPIAIEGFKLLLGRNQAKIRFVNEWVDQVKEVDVVIIATAWPEYKKLQSMRLESVIVFDARKMLNKSALSAKDYLTIGYRSLLPLV